ncbi:HAMP domain-containing protein [Verticiella sediminum]|uniref:histidine kinase n=1 Tax=Verticiella sediminum TaxID=1247510 RepID=A0A556ABR0_9BURK|nr:ATP-binding protein [Verticiella sediminum]TSH90310.1 HAMP domain-containing protein [Verticiella sediminum]
MRKFARWGLFGRTFLLLTLLMIASLAAWLQAFRNMEIEPRAHQMAQQIVTAVNITRAALVYSAPIRRRFLLLDLATNEGIQIYPRDPADRTEPLPDTTLMQWVAARITHQLGPNTQIKWAVNDMPGLWVSFSIEGDNYWAVLERARTERYDGVQWLGWGLAALLLSLLGAAMIVGFVNRPLSRLARAAQALSRGETPAPLPEDTGPDEIRSVNASFNRMVNELDRAEADRALMLAGISHDLRTPLARIRLEVEMSPMSEEARDGIDQDLAQIDHTIGQFMEYARPPVHTEELIDVSGLLERLVERERAVSENRGGTLQANVEPGQWSRIDPSDLTRAVVNLIENARKYGHLPGLPTQIDVYLQARGNDIVILICDHGPGISREERERLVRPFVRGEHARTDASGAGLGLAIVNRLLAPAGGGLDLLSREDGLPGLCARITLPAYKAARMGSGIQTETA